MPVQIGRWDIVVLAQMVFFCVTSCFSMIPDMVESSFRGEATLPHSFVDKSSLEGNRELPLA